MGKLAVFVIMVCLALVLLSSLGISGPAGESLTSAAERIEIVRDTTTGWAGELPECDLWCVLDILPELQ